MNPIGILLVLYNDKENIPQLIQSLLDQTYQDFKIFAIETSSSGKSLEHLKRLHPSTNCFDYRGNLGFAAGNNYLANQALKADCKYLFILNPDMELSDNTLEVLIRSSEQESNIGIVSAILLFGKNEAKKEKIQLFGGKANFKTQKKKFLFSNQYLNKVDLPKLMNVDFVNGGSTFIKSEVINKIGLFEEKYFMYNEEIDLSNRVKNAGYKIIVTSETKIWHHHDWGRNNSINYKLMYYYIMRNRYIYYKKFNLYFNLLVDLMLQAISLPIKLKWFYKLSSISITKYYYLGIVRGIIGETGKTKEIFK